MGRRISRGPIVYLVAHGGGQPLKKRIDDKCSYEPNGEHPFQFVSFSADIAEKLAVVEDTCSRWASP